MFVDVLISEMYFPKHVRTMANGLRFEKDIRFSCFVERWSTNDHLEENDTECKDIHFVTFVSSTSDNLRSHILTGSYFLIHHIYFIIFLCGKAKVEDLWNTTLGDDDIIRFYISMAITFLMNVR